MSFLETNKQLHVIKVSIFYSREKVETTQYLITGNW